MNLVYGNNFSLKKPKVSSLKMLLDPKNKYSSESLSNSTKYSIEEDDNSLEKIVYKSNKNYSSSYLNKKKINNSQSTLRNFQNGIKYKTEICKNFVLYKNCKFGINCCFAHGKHELRKKKDFNFFYKTKICKHFHQKGFCPYGNRCQYFHFNSNKIFDELLDTLIKKIELNFKEKNSKNLFLFLKETESFHSRLKCFKRIYSNKADYSF